MDIINAYQELGSYRAAAALCGTCHKTARQVVERWREEGLPGGKRERPRNTDGVKQLVAERVRASDGRISAKRLLPVAKAAGYMGSARNFRRVVAEAKGEWKRRRRVYRPWVPTPGSHLVIDWGTEAGVQVFCAVLAWSRYRFVRFAVNQRREATLALLAECFEEMGGVPAIVLADRMGCLRAATVAGLVVPHPDYVRFATHFGFRPDFCEGADPESKGVVEALVGYAKADLVVPMSPGLSLMEANEAARRWCAEVNGRLHSEISAIPAERLGQEASLFRPLPSLRPSLSSGELRKVDRLSTVRFGSARYSVPHELVGVHVSVVVQDGMVILCHQGIEVARHNLVAPGEVSTKDAHYGGPVRRPTRAIRPRSKAELALLSLGAIAEEFLRAAAAAGTSRLEGELSAIVDFEAAWGRAALIKALERAVRFSRFKASDIHSMLLAGDAVPTLTRPGEPLWLDLPAVPTRPLSAYALEALR